MGVMIAVATKVAGSVSIGSVVVNSFIISILYVYCSIEGLALLKRARLGDAVRSNKTEVFLYGVRACHLVVGALISLLLAFEIAKAVYISREFLHARNLTEQIVAEYGESLDLDEKSAGDVYERIKWSVSRLDEFEVLHGECIAYFRREGFDRAEMTFTLDSLDGPYRAYFDEDVLAIQGDFENWKAMGEWQFWHPNGNLRTSGKMRGGVGDGEWTYWDASGTEQWQDAYPKELFDVLMESIPFSPR